MTHGQPMGEECIHSKYILIKSTDGLDQSIMCDATPTGGIARQRMPVSQCRFTIPRQGRAISTTSNHMASTAGVLRHKLGGIALASQGLTSKWPFGRGLGGARRAIEHLGYVQIDAISVINRAHLHTLWNRLPDFSQAHLDRLIRERVVFEYWFHAASYLPMRDFRFALPRMKALQEGKRHWGLNEQARILRGILERIRLDGPLKARDLSERRPERQSGGWWSFGPIKRGLIQLQMQGDLIVEGRDGFEKSYDLPERVIPSWVNTGMPSTRELGEHLVTTALRAQGVTGLAEIVHLRRDGALRQAVTDILHDRQATGELIKLVVQETPYYLSAASFEAPARRAQPQVRLLSPFDNAIIHRQRTRHLHGFDYTLECYVPPDKRRFGYFCLPILFGKRFVGRADCKAHRHAGIFEVRHLSLEHPPTEPARMATFCAALSSELVRLAEWHNCAQVRITRTTPENACFMEIDDALRPS